MFSTNISRHLALGVQHRLLPPSFGCRVVWVAGALPQGVGSWCLTKGCVVWVPYQCGELVPCLCGHQRGEVGPTSSAALPSLCKLAIGPLANQSHQRVKAFIARLMRPG